MNDKHGLNAQINQMFGGNMNDTQLDADIDEHHKTEEYWEQRQAAKDTWVDGGIDESMKDPAMFQEYLKESASEDLNGDLHQLLMSGMDMAFFWKMWREFEKYCRESLEESWEMKMG